MEHIKRIFHSCISFVDLGIYVDPFGIKEENHDAKIILITHDHFDHLSIDDINKIITDETIFVVPNHFINKIEEQYQNEVFGLLPNETIVIYDYIIKGVVSYNVEKPFHPKEALNLGYLITINEVTYYIAGDTDYVPELDLIKSDVVLLPVGGKYTMNIDEALALTLSIQPKIAIPTHYGDLDSCGTKEDGERFVSLLPKHIKGIIL